MISEISSPGKKDLNSWISSDMKMYLVWNNFIYTLSSIRKNFINNTRLKLTKNKAKAKQLNFLYLEIIRFLHPRYLPKIIEDILNNVQKISASALMMLYD